MILLIWHRRASVSQRSIFEVLNRTCAVEPVGLNGSGMVLMGRILADSEAVIAAVIWLQVMSDKSWYFGKAGSKTQ